MAVRPHSYDSRVVSVSVSVPFSIDTTMGMTFKAESLSTGGPIGVQAFRLHRPLRLRVNFSPEHVVSIETDISFSSETILLGMHSPI